MCADAADDYYDLRGFAGGYRLFCEDIREVFRCLGSQPHHKEIFNQFLAPPDSVFGVSGRRDFFHYCYLLSLLKRNEGKDPEPRLADIGSDAFNGVVGPGLLVKLDRPIAAGARLSSFLNTP